MYEIISGNQKILQIIKTLPINKKNEFTGKDFRQFMLEISDNTQYVLGKQDLYKNSRFNYIQENEDSVFIYNTLYNSFINLDSQEYEMYLRKRDVTKEIFTTFVENGLWIEKEVDEYTKYLCWSKTYTLFKERLLTVTITTTTKCNARCTYCYEKGIKQVDIFEGAEEKIIEFIKEHIIQNTVQLIWFGGEPLMNTKFMDSLSKRLKEEKIHYTSFIITNGSLLTENIIYDKFKLWNVTNIQVTLDGTKEEYESKKNYLCPQKDNFNTVLYNIRIASTYNVHISIRLNITKDNKIDIINLVKELENLFAKQHNVLFYPAFVTGNKDSFNEEEKIQCIKELLSSITNVRKLTAGTKFYSFPKMNACMNGDPRHFTIDVFGNIYTCEHCVGRNDRAIGNITERIYVKDNRGKNKIFREECKNCVFLPKCYGGCEANILTGDSPCMIEKYVIKAYLEIL